MNRLRTLIFVLCLWVPTVLRPAAVAHAQERSGTCRDLHGFSDASAGFTLGPFAPGDHVRIDITPLPADVPELVRATAVELKVNGATVGSTGVPGTLEATVTQPDSTLMTVSDGHFEYLFFCEYRLPAPGAAPSAPAGASSDSRLNWQQGDLVAAIYPSVGDDSTPAVDVYTIQPDSTGEFACRVTQAEVGGAPPAETTLVKQCGERAAIFRLTDGRVQFNLGPDAAGKTTVVIMDGIPPQSVSSYEIPAP